MVYFDMRDVSWLDVVIGKQHYIPMIYYRTFHHLEQMENLLFSGVPILKHIRVIRRVPLNILSSVIQGRILIGFNTLP